MTLCGGLSVARRGELVDLKAVARQGRLVLSFLLVNRARSAARDQLIDLLWPGTPPSAPEAALSAVIARLRRALGSSTIVANQAEISLDLGAGVWIDVDAAAAAVASADTARELGDRSRVIQKAQEAVDLLEARLLPEFDGPWVEQRRDQLDALRVEALELIADAGLSEGGFDLRAAERAATELIQHAPLREVGYGLLMRSHAARGHTAEATLVFDDLRSRLLDELGTPPSRALIALNDRLLRQEELNLDAANRQTSAIPARLAVAVIQQLVDRRSEAELLRRRWDEGSGIVFVGGEPGIGKTLLAAHAALYAADRGGTILYGGCEPTLRAPYEPFAELIGWYIEQRGQSALLTCSSAELQQLMRLVPSLAEGGVDHDAAAGDRQQLFDAVTAVLRAAARERPLLIVVDDVHWADASTLLMLRHIADVLVDQPVVLVVTYRRAEPGTAATVALAADLAREQRPVDRLELVGLDPQDTASLLRATLLAEAGPAFARELCELTGGNPFLIGEAARAVDARSAKGAPTVADVRALGVTSPAREMILARVRDFDQESRDLLTVAAVAGGEIDVKLLDGIVPQARNGRDGRLAELVGADLMFELPGRQSFRITHELLRDALYAELDPAWRTELHARIGSYLLQRGDTEPAELAWHFFEARSLVGAAPAVEHLRGAARRATLASAHEEAIAHFSQALIALDTADAPSDRDRDRCIVALELADALERTHDISSARARYLEAARLAQRLDDADLLARAACGFGRWGRYGVVDQTAIDLLERSVEALPAGRPAMRALVLARLAVRLDPVDSQDRRDALHREALAAARSVGDPETLREVLSAGTHVLGRPVAVPARLALAQEAVALERDGGDRVRRAWAELACVVSLLELGRIPEAQDALSSFSTIVDDLRQPFFSWQRDVVSATFAVLDGRLDDAAELVGTARVIEAEHDPGAVETWAAQTLMLARARGHFEDADYEAISRAAERHAKLPMWRAMLARAEAGLGDLAQARRNVERCLAAAWPPTVEWLPTATILAETAGALGDSERVAELRQLIEPFAGRITVIQAAWATWGPVSEFL